MNEIEKFARVSFFVEIGHFSSTLAFERFLGRHKIVKEGQMVPIGQVIKALQDDVNKVEHEMGNDVDLDTVEKKEKIMKLQIDNNVKLGKLVDVEVVKARVKTTLYEIVNGIRFAIKSSSTELSIARDPRECEQILTNAWNMTIKKIEEQAEMKEWEDESEAIVRRNPSSTDS